MRERIGAALDFDAIMATLESLWCHRGAPAPCVRGRIARATRRGGARRVCVGIDRAASAMAELPEQDRPRHPVAPDGGGVARTVASGPKPRLTRRRAAGRGASVPRIAWSAYDPPERRAWNAVAVDGVPMSRAYASDTPGGFPCPDGSRDRSECAKWALLPTWWTQPMLAVSRHGAAPGRFKASRFPCRLFDASALRRRADAAEHRRNARPSNGAGRIHGSAVTCPHAKWGFSSTESE